MTGSQLSAELRAVFRGHIGTGAVELAAYSRDASLLRVTPMGVVAPADEDDLRALLAFAAENQLTLTPRGAGSASTGASLTRGLVVEMNSGFRRCRILDGFLVEAECGVRFSEIQKLLRPLGRRIPVNPKSERVTTVGGMLATDAHGSNATRHGTIRDYVESIRVMWNTGQTERYRLADAHPSPRATEIEEQLRQEFDLFAPRLATQPTESAVRHCGYDVVTAIQNAASSRRVDLGALLIGSEGTLAIITGAVLRTVPLPAAEGGLLLGFRTMTEALRCGLSLRSGNREVISCEMYDQRSVAVAQQRNTTGRADFSRLPPDVQAVLLIRAECDSAERLEDYLESVGHRAADMGKVIVLKRGYSPDASAELRMFGDELTLAQCSTLPNGGRPVAVVEDTAVPGDVLLRYVSGVVEYLRDAEFPAMFCIDTLGGHLDVRPIYHPANDAELAKLWPLAEKVHRLAIDAGGAVASRHGVGILRAPWYANSAEPLAKLHREIKRIFDPDGLFNPWNLVQIDPSMPAWPMARPETDATERVPLLLWDGEAPTAQAARCSRCAECVSLTPAGRQCPAYLGGLLELASPRGQVAALELLHSGRLDDTTTLDELRTVAGACVQCKMCRTECPSAVDVPGLALELKARILAEEGQSRQTWVLSHIGSLTQLAAYLPFLANFALQQHTLRFLLERMTGLSRRTLLPLFAGRTFLARAKARGWHRRTPGPATRRVALFVDTFTNYADPTIAEAAALVLQHHGVDVHVPQHQRGTGVAALHHGDLERARAQASHAVRLFADLIRLGYTPVCLDPTSLVTVTQDYLRLFDDEDTRLLAASATEITQYLWNIHAAGELKVAFPIPLAHRLGHHVPCHIKALRTPPAGPKLLELIPGLRVDVIDVSCSGLAGTFGLQACNSEASRRIGGPMIEALSRPTIRYGSTECGSCRIQMQQTTRKRTMHPVQYLALAYGLMPKLAKRLAKPLGKLATD